MTKRQKRRQFELLNENERKLLQGNYSLGDKSVVKRRLIQKLKELSVSQLLKDASLIIDSKFFAFMEPKDAHLLSVALFDKKRLINTAKESAQKLEKTRLYERDTRIISELSKLKNDKPAYHLILSSLARNPAGLSHHNLLNEARKHAGNRLKITKKHISKLKEFNLVQKVIITQIETKQVDGRIVRVNRRINNLKITETGLRILYWLQTGKRPFYEAASQKAAMASIPEFSSRVFALKIPLPQNPPEAP